MGERVNVISVRTKKKYVSYLALRLRICQFFFIYSG